MTEPTATGAPDQTITEKTLNSTRFGGVTAAGMGVVTALVPVITALTEKDVPASIIVGLEALAAVLAVVAAWIYKIDAQTRADLAKARLAAVASSPSPPASIAAGMPFTVQERMHPGQRENVLGLKYDPKTEVTSLLVAEQDGSPAWHTLTEVERAERYR